MHGYVWYMGCTLINMSVGGLHMYALKIAHRTDRENVSDLKFALACSSVTELRCFNVQSDNM